MPTLTDIQDRIKSGNKENEDNHFVETMQENFNAIRDLGLASDNLTETKEFEDAMSFYFDNVDKLIAENDNDADEAEYTEYVKTLKEVAENEEGLHEDFDVYLAERTLGVLVELKKAEEEKANLEDDEFFAEFMEYGLHNEREQKAFAELDALDEMKTLHKSNEEDAGEELDEARKVKSLQDRRKIGRRMRIINNRGSTKAKKKRTKLSGKNIRGRIDRLAYKQSRLFIISRLTGRKVQTASDWMKLEPAKKMRIDKILSSDAMKKRIMNGVARFRVSARKELMAARMKAQGNDKEANILSDKGKLQRGIRKDDAPANANANSGNERGKDYFTARSVGQNVDRYKQKKAKRDAKKAAKLAARGGQ